jgi:hypothetical protein
LHAARHSGDELPARLAEDIVVNDAGAERDPLAHRIGGPRARFVALGREPQLEIVLAKPQRDTHGGCRVAASALQGVLEDSVQTEVDSGRQRSRLTVHLQFDSLTTRARAVDQCVDLSDARLRLTPWWIVAVA